MEDTKYIIIGAISIVTYCISRPILRDNLGLSTPILPLAVAGLCFVSLSGYSGKGGAIIHLYGALGITFVAFIVFRVLVGVFALRKSHEWSNSVKPEDGNDPSGKRIAK